MPSCTARSRGEHFTIRVQLHSDHVRVECQDAPYGSLFGKRPDLINYGLTG
jgi:hypothetical protein